MDRLVVGRREVAVLVEDVVGRQQALERPADGLAAGTERGGVPERLARVGRVRVGAADEEREAVVRERGDPVEGVALGGDERLPGEQVPGRVARDGEFGEDGEVGVGLRARSAAPAMRSTLPSTSPTV